MTIGATRNENLPRSLGVSSLYISVYYARNCGETTKYAENLQYSSIFNQTILNLLFYNNKLSPEMTQLSKHSGRGDTANMRFSGTALYKRGAVL